MARPLPRRRREAVASAQLTGERIAYHRKRLGLSQVEFAGLIGRSDSWVSQVERGVRSVDRLSVLQRVADALGVPVAELRGTDADDSASTDDRPEALAELRLALTGHPAIEVVLGSTPEPLTSERLGQLREMSAQVWPMVHASRYTELAPLAARLVPELEQAVRSPASDELTEAARQLLTDTYQAVAAMMAKVGETDAAWVASDRAAFTAEALDDPLAVAASLFCMAHAFLTLREVGQAQGVAREAVEGLEQQAEREPTAQTLSLCGAFHLVLAIGAARDNNRPEAHEHLDQARAIADRIGEDRDDFGTEFGPTNVELHAVGVAVDLGDAGLAIDLARRIQPEQLSPERQARYLIDLAHAHAMRRQIGEALRCLEEAERLTPEQTRTRPGTPTL
jgi:transcriptional regulator with XRE-family HTH domain